MTIDITNASPQAFEIAENLLSFAQREWAQRDNEQELTRSDALIDVAEALDLESTDNNQRLFELIDSANDAILTNTTCHFRAASHQAICEWFEFIDAQNAAE